MKSVFLIHDLNKLLTVLFPRGVNSAEKFGGVGEMRYLCR